jgi:hypothetical protein
MNKCAQTRTCPSWRSRSLGLRIHGKARLGRDVLVSDQVYVEQAIGAVARAQEVDLAETPAPAFQSEQQRVPLLLGALDAVQASQFLDALAQGPLSLVHIGRKSPAPCYISQ